MNKISPVLAQIAPTLALALKGPFAPVAHRYIEDHLPLDALTGVADPHERLRTLLDDAKKLQLIKDLDQPFRLELQQLGVDLQALESNAQPEGQAGISPQVLITVLFMLAYFAMLAAIFYVEISDEMNMITGDNSLMEELQILFGVLTAGVLQILSYWFGGVLGKTSP